MQSTGIKLGQDTLILNDYIFTTQGIGDTYNFDITEQTIEMDVGNTGTVLFAKNAKWNTFTLTIAVPVSSADDLQLEQWWTQTGTDFINAPTFTGSFTRISGDTGTGTLTRTAYAITTGMMSKGAPMKTNSTGDPTQMIATYEIRGTAFRVTN